MFALIHIHLYFSLIRSKSFEQQLWKQYEFCKQANVSFTWHVLLNNEQMNTHRHTYYVWIAVGNLWLCSMHRTGQAPVFCFTIWMATKESMMQDASNNNNGTRYSNRLKYITNEWKKWKTFSWDFISFDSWNSNILKEQIWDLMVKMNLEWTSKKKIQLNFGENFSFIRKFSTMILFVGFLLFSTSTLVYTLFIGITIKQFDFIHQSLTLMILS